MRSLPLITLYLTERCNSRCVTCDYWRTGKEHATLESVRRMLPGLERLGTRVALLSGGEPLLNPEWRAIAEALTARGIETWLLTSGLSLAKHASVVAATFRSVTVSLDGTTPATYQAIRGLDAFDVVCHGVRAAVGAGANVSLRVTVQKTNYRELPQFVRLARELGVSQVSFLAVDVGNPHAFGRDRPFGLQLALSPDDLAAFEALIASMEREFAAEFSSGFIAEAPHKLRRMRSYFAALNGLEAFPEVRCNAPEFSAVIGVRGRMSPCFFIPGPETAIVDGDPLPALDSAPMRNLRADIRAGRRPECVRCVCSLWRDPARPDRLLLAPRARECA